MIDTNIGAYIAPRFALQRTASGAGQGGNVGAVSGEIINRGLVRPLHRSGKLMVGYKTTLVSGRTLGVVAQPTHSSDGVVFTSLGNATTVTVTGLGGNPVQKGVVEVDVNLAGAHPYVGCIVTPTLSASGSDIAEVFGMWGFGGGETVPATESAQ